MNATDPFAALEAEHYETRHRFARRLARAAADAMELVPEMFRGVPDSGAPVPGPDTTGEYDERDYSSTLLLELLGFE